MMQCSIQSCRAQLLQPARSSRRAQRSSRLDVQARNRILFHAHELPQAGHPSSSPVQLSPLAIGAQATALLQPGQVLTLPASDSRSQHAREVLRLRPGDSLKVGVVGGNRADAAVAALPDTAGDGEGLQGALQLSIARVYEPLPGPQVDLLLALPRPKVLRRLWPMLGELGVGHVVLTGAERVEPAFFDAGAALAPEEIYDGLVKGCEQAGCTHVPPVALSRTLRGALRHWKQLSSPGWALPPPLQAAPGAARATLPAAPGQAQGGQLSSREAAGREQQRQHRNRKAAGGEAGQGQGQGSAEGPPELPWGVSYLLGSWQAEWEAAQGTANDSRTQYQHSARLLAHPYSDTPVLQAVQQAVRQHADASKGGSPRVLVAIGPEGGWRGTELELLQDQGFAGVNAGPRILTSTTALCVLVGSVQQGLLLWQGNAEGKP